MTFDRITGPGPLLTASFALVATLCVALLTTPAVAQDYRLPDIGEPADNTLSPGQEREIGARVMTQLLEAGLVLEDPELSLYITRLGNELASYANGISPSALRFFVIRDPRINAFALPGGYIGVNAGLLMASESESELAGVLSHEIAHVSQRHIARQLEESGRWDLATAALVLAAIIAGANDPDIIQAAVGVGMATAVQQRINFTRAHELEADRIGIGTLAAAGYAPQGMAAFFQRLEQKSRLYGNAIPEILQTHPVNSTRIAEANARAARYDVPGRADPPAYRLMQARARVLSANEAGEALEHYRRLLTVEPNRIEVRYGYALSLMNAARADEALPLLEKLAAERRNDVNLMLALADAQRQTNRDDAARDSIKTARAAFPRYAPLLLVHADMLIRDGKPAEARQMLLAANGSGTGHPDAFRLLATAANDLGDRSEAHYQMAAYERSRGDFRAAMSQLRAGLDDESLSDSDRARLEARLALYKAESPVSERRRDKR